ncbi:MAG: phenylacetate-CoA oxygenase subunit PaaC [Chitinophagaceae bacterium]|nr:phenylacetate-CoA oxygenase subunit PaaC [Chitinophagaceae bacterium]
MITEKEQLVSFVLHLADDSLVLGHRNSEWTGHGPILEQDIAISNIALDLIGQARNFYQYAAALKADGATEDTLAYLRDAMDYKNALIAELNKGDWAVTTLRQFFFSTSKFYLYQQLQNNSDTTLAAIAEKSLKEVTYHLRWSAEWVIRLGDGTDESNARVKTALEYLWPYTGELITPASYEQAQPGIDFAALKKNWTNHVLQVLEQALLTPPVNDWMQSGGKQGIHTEHLGYLLAEMQYLQRSYPGCEW